MEWEIQKRSKSCNSCGREFGEGDMYFCILKVKDGMPVREDYCEFCRNSNDVTSEEQDYLSYWRSRVKPVLIQKKEDPIQRSVAEKLLRKYIHSSDPSHKNLCYVLAVMLERKRELAPKKNATPSGDGRKLIVYEHSKTGESLIIEDPELGMSEIARVQQQVSGILQAEQVAMEQE